MADLLGTKHEGDIVRAVNVTRDNFSWTNFDGVTKGIKDLDVQHLSNIYYFIKYLAPEYYSDKTVNLFNEEIDIRLDGIPLPYKPLRSFSREIEVLRLKGYLKEVEGKTLIFVDGREIGEVFEG